MKNYFLTKRLFQCSLISICILISLVFPLLAYGQTQAPLEIPNRPTGKTKFLMGQAPENDVLIIFYSPGCHKCIETKAKLMPDIEREFKGRIQLEYRDITDIENYKLLLSLKEEYGSKLEHILPVFFFSGHFLNGRGQIKEALRALITKSLSQKPEGKQGSPKIDLLAYFRTFEPLAIVGAGLTDGINPCAFTVIVFFISFLSLQGYKKRELIIIGLAFIFAVLITYLAIGLGLFSFLYRIRGFWLISRIFNLTVGIFSIILGILAVYDFFKFKRTAQTEGLLLQLPQGIKNRIHSLIGLHYRRTKEENGKTLKPYILRLALSALIVGILVSILEAVCTGQVYLPAITFVLKIARFKLQALGYLVLYNIMFIVPLFIIFLFALLGVTSEQFSQILRKHLSAIKILMAILFFGLGIFLLFSLQGCYAQEQTKTANQAEAEIIDPYSWDFGQAKEGEALKHAFVLKNESRETLTLKDVSSSCGCTASKVGKKILLPGESTEIEVQFNSKGYSGNTQQYVYVHTDSLDASTSLRTALSERSESNGRSRTIDNSIIRFIIKAEVK